MFYVGRAYEIGEGVQRDYAKALEWFRRTLEPSLPPFPEAKARAETKIGIMYDGGQGVPQDFSEAAKWYRKASEDGDDWGQWFLGYMYEEGRGVAQDFVQAYMWFNLASASGEIPQASASRNRLQRKMTPEQIAEGQTLSRSWKKQDPQKAPPLEASSTQGPEPDATGTGFFVDALGHFLTNNHVVQGCQTVRIQFGEKLVNASLLAVDPSNDLALLQTRFAPTAAHFRKGSFRPGATVTVLGFPLRGLLASGPTITTGVVSSLSGLYDDTRELQISAPVQPGNSGGPALDNSGNVIGIVSSKLDAMEVQKVTGDIPQNVNFAIKAGVAESFLDANNVHFLTAPSAERLDATAVAESARRFTALVEC